MEAIWMVVVFLASLGADLASSVMAADDPTLEEAGPMPRRMVAHLGLGPGLAAASAQELALVIGLVSLLLATGGAAGAYFLLAAVSALHLAAGVNNARLRRGPRGPASPRFGP